MATSDKVREYALITFIKPARNRAKKQSSTVRWVFDLT
jgi:hypothetical protein